MNQELYHICYQQERKKHLHHIYGEKCVYDPLEGRILMFPAWLWHCVEPNESNDIRISVSFNFIQKGFDVLNIK